jgi:tRNA nucleotidyltransferase/poly(A) polymerase
MEESMDKKQIIDNVIVPIEKKGFHAYFVGGCVRDALMNVEPHDYDICTDATPKQLHTIFEKFSNVSENAEQFGVTMPLVKVDNTTEEFEIATMRRDITKGRHPKVVFTTDMKEDAMRRDFTVNALYEDRKGEIYDPTGLGLKDIKKNTLRFVGDAWERVTEDPLRLWRYVRFVSQKGFEPLDEKVIKLPNGEKTEELEFLTKKVLEVGTEKLFADISKERQLKELVGIFGGERFDRDIISLMGKFGILSHIGLSDFLEDMRNCEQSAKWHKEGNVFNHTMLVVEAMKSQEHDWLDMLAAVLHDIGKPEAGRQNGLKNGIPIVHGHDTIGAPIAYDFCKNLGMRNEDCEMIKWLVENHMLAHRISETKSKYKVWKLVSHKWFDRLLKLSIADSKGSLHEVPDETPDLCELIKEKWVADLIGKSMPKPLVNGIDLICLGLKPNKNFSKALEVGYKMQIDNNAQKKDIISNISSLAKESA